MTSSHSFLEKPSQDTSIIFERINTLGLLLGNPKTTLFLKVTSAQSNSFFAKYITVYHSSTLQSLWVFKMCQYITVYRSGCFLFASNPDSFIAPDQPQHESQQLCFLQLCHQDRSLLPRPPFELKLYLCAKFNNFYNSATRASL